MNVFFMTILWRRRIIVLILQYADALAYAEEHSKSNHHDPYEEIDLSAKEVQWNVYHGIVH
jgi:hypothetical protein